MKDFRVTGFRDPEAFETNSFVIPNAFTRADTVNHKKLKDVYPQNYRVIKQVIQRTDTPIKPSDHKNVVPIYGNNNSAFFALRNFTSIQMYAITPAAKPRINILAIGLINASKPPF